ncbi:MAG: glycosyltransferase [Pseudoxanthomonas sp.]
MHYSIDSLVVRDGKLFGWGWAISSAGRAASIDILVTGPAGVWVIECLPGGMRRDLIDAFPNIPYAGSSGFMIQGVLPRGAVVTSASLRVHMKAGGIETGELPAHLLTEKEAVRSTLWRLKESFRSRGLVTTIVAALRFSVTRCKRLLADGHTRRGLAAHGGGRGNVLIFDHAMGGGANRFRDELVQRVLSEGQAVTIVTPDLSTLSYRIELRQPFGNGKSDHANESSGLGVLLDRIASIAWSRIYINNLVSFEAPLDIMAFCLERRSEGVALSCFVHDFFSVCQAWSLVNDEGRYCGVPALGACAPCLANQKVPFRAFYRDVQPAEWRERWAQLLLSCDEITAFSRSSVDIMRKAFGDVIAGRIVVNPHRVDYLSGVRIEPALEGILNVALIGHISAIKGAHVVRDLVAFSASSRVPLRFKVFGSIEGNEPSEHLEVLGPYRTEDLPSLMKDHGIGICLLPSICPETFSYVTSEVMDMGMPIAVFDLGAPAERTRNYKYGLILKSQEPEHMAASLLAFRDALLNEQKKQD